MSEDEQKRILEEWLCQQSGLIFKIVRAYAFTPMDREDLFQEIFILVMSVASFQVMVVPS